MRKLAEKLFEATRDGLVDAGEAVLAENNQAVVEFAKAVATASLAEAVQNLDDEVANGLRILARSISNWNC